MNQWRGGGMAYAGDLKSLTERYEGSTPSLATKTNYA